MTKLKLQLSISTSETITFVQHPHSIDYFTTDNILQFGFCTEHSYLGNILLKYLKSENLYTVKYCSVFVLLNTIKYILNKDLSTPLILHLFYCVHISTFYIGS